MLHRVRARMRFTAASGMAGWCHAQMGVRHGQAEHIRPGGPAEEAPLNEVAGEGADQVFTCDLPLADEAAAVDAVSTLTAASVLAWASEYRVSRERCRHDETPPGACELADEITNQE